MNKGIPIILLGYFFWGLFPLFWSLLSHVSALEVLAHRMLWSVPVLLLFISVVKNWRNDFFSALADKKELGFLLFTALLITVNWGVYIVAVNQERVVEASMGYFLSPLLSILGGFIVFKERISKLKRLAVLFAAIVVIYYIASVSVFPLLGLIVGLSFAAYGTLRKLIKTAAVPGLLVETLLLLPFSVAYVVYIFVNQQASFLNSSVAFTDLWLMLAGIVTVVPLVLFTAGARLLPMTTSGILFYITPSLQFLSGVYFFGEQISPQQLIGFAGIWIGLLIYSYSLIADHSIARSEKQPA